MASTSDAPMTPEPTAAPCECGHAYRKHLWWKMDGDGPPVVGECSMECLCAEYRPLAAATVPREETRICDCPTIPRCRQLGCEKLRASARHPSAPPSPAAPELGALRDDLFAAASDVEFVANGGTCDPRTLLEHAEVLRAHATPSPACSEQGIVDFFMDRDRQ
jgi:hypothetical protein